MSAAQSNSRWQALSWRWNLLWTSAGTAIYAASSWAMLSVIAKLGTPEMVGEYALALAVVTPVLMLAQMNLRALLATDARGQYGFRDYRRLRMNATVLAMLAIAGIAAAGYPFRLAALIAATGLAQGVEGVADIYYGLMQRHERMDRITISLTLRAGLSLAAMVAVIGLTGSVLAGVCGMFLTRLAVTAVYDAGRGSRDFVAAEPRVPYVFRQTMAQQMSIFWLALPLSGVMLLNSLSTNMPRYLIEHHMGARELGIFSAAASLVAVGNNLVNAVGQTLMPRLAKAFAWGDAAGFARMGTRLLAFGLALALCVVGCSVLLGRWVLTWMFRPEYARHPELLIAVMAAGGIGYMASLLGYAVTAARSFRPQAPLFAVVTVLTYAACALLIPARGLMGAALAMGISSATQFAGLLYLFLRLTAKARTAGVAVAEAVNA
jgi:O-antigen/teichoic acid export membrane protein